MRKIFFRLVWRRHNVNLLVILAFVLPMLALAIVVGLDLQNPKPAEAAWKSMTFYSSSGDSYIWHSDANYADARGDASTVGAVQNVDALEVGQSNSGGYGIARGALYWDTSGLPAGIVVKSATVSVYALAAWSASEDDELYVGYGDMLSTPTAGADYGEILDHAFSSPNYGSITSENWVNGQYNDIPLTGTGWHVSPTLTKYSIYCIRDKSDIAPTDIDFFQFYGGHWGSNKPKLTIQYVQKPSVTTSTASSIASTSMTLNGSITDDGGENCILVGYVWDTSSHAAPAGAPPGAYANSWTTAGAVLVSHVIAVSEGTHYYFRAGAMNSAGWAWGGELDDWSLPGDPSGLAITGATTTSIDLSWTNGAGSANIMIRGKVGSYPANVGDGYEAWYGGGTTHTDTPLSSATHYYYRAWARNGDGDYSSSYTETNGWTNNGLPTVTSSIATIITNSTAILNGTITDTGGFDDDSRGFVWDTSSHGDPGNVAPAASGYANPWTEGGSFGVAGFSHAISISPGIKYYFRSCAHEIAPGGGWDYSNTEQSFTSLPEDPSGLAITGGNAISLSFSWTAGSGAARSVLRYSVSTPPSTPYSGSLGYNDTSNACTVASLTPGQLYYFRLWSWVAGSDIFSSGYDGTFSYTSPGIPAPFYAEQVTSSRIDLSWTKGTGSNMTVIRSRTDKYPTSRTDGALIYNGTSSTHSDVSLTIGREYFYRAWSFSNVSGLYSDEFGEDNAETIGNPDATTLSATGVSVSTSKLNSYISDDGGYNCNLRFQWTPWPIAANSSAPDAMEFNDLDGSNITMCRINGDFVALAYRGPSGHGWISTFSLNRYGNFSGTGHQFIDSFEFENTDTVVDTSMIKYPASHTYAIFCRDGATGVPKVYTVHIDDKGSGFAAIDEKNIAAGVAAITKLDAVYCTGNYFAVAYTGAANDGYISTVEVPSSGHMAISPVIDSWTYEVGTIDWNQIAKVYQNIYAVAYSNSTVSNVFSFTIGTNGVITKSAIDTLQFSAGVISYISLCNFNSDIYAITGRAVATANGWMFVFTMSNTGMISDTVLSSVQFDAVYAAYTKAVTMPGGVGIFYRTTANAGIVKLYPLASNYTISAPTTLLQFNGTWATDIDAMQVTDDEYAVAYTGANGDGWLHSVKIECRTWSDSSTYETPYVEGQTYSKTVGSLALDTEYYYRVQIYNSINGIARARNGTAIMFKTLDQVYAPTELSAVATSGTTVSLSWNKGAGSFTTVIKYMSGSYPPNHNTGLLAYNGTESSITVSGLVPGTMYYFRAWGWAPGSPEWWSVGYTEDSTNTPADMTPINPFADPGEPAKWIIAASNNPSNSFFKASIISAANSIGMPAGTLFLILYVAISCGIGLFTFLISRSMFLCFIAISCCFGGLTMMSILPLWILVAYVLLAGGVWYMMARVV